MKHLQKKKYYKNRFKQFDIHELFPHRHIYKHILRIHHLRLGHPIPNLYLENNKKKMHWNVK